MLNPRKDTFDEYRENQKQQRIGFISKALVVLSNAKYVNITRLAKDVAKLVTEFEAKVYMAKAVSERDETLKPISHVTLLRNVAYRKILEDFMGVEDRPEPSINGLLTDFEALKIRNASLETQNFLLKEKIRSIDLTGGHTVIPLGGASVEEVSNALKIIQVLIDIYDRIDIELGGGLEIIKDGAKTDRKDGPGLYGPLRRIASMDELELMDRARRMLKAKSISISA